MTRHSLLPLVLVVALGAAAPPPLDTLRAEIAEHGARVTVSGLYTTNRWDAVLSQIDSGHEDWIDLAPSLAVGTVGATAEGLTISLATALPANPAAVLAVVVPGSDGSLGVSRVCSAPFIEDGVDRVAYRARTLRALARTPVTPIRAACIAALKAHG